MRKPTDVVSPELAVDIRLGILALESGLGRPVDLPGLERVDEPEFGPEQTYGPMSAWVVTNARAVLGLSHLDILTAHMELAAHAQPTIVTAAALEMTAEGPGRSEACEAARTLARRVSSRLRQRRGWRIEVAGRAEELRLSRGAAGEYLSGHLDAFVKQVLVACALEDVMQPALRLQSLGAWRCLTSASEDDPGSEWRCSDQTANTLRRFFADMDEDTLIWTLDRILAPTDLASEAVQHRLIGSTLVRAASPPPLAEIIGPGLVEALSYRGGHSLIDQVARLLAALCEPPAWLSPDDLVAARDLFAGSDVDWPTSV